jgi:hypothetical protein
MNEKCEKNGTAPKNGRVMAPKKRASDSKKTGGEPGHIPSPPEAPELRSPRFVASELVLPEPLYIVPSPSLCR